MKIKFKFKSRTDRRQVESDWAEQMQFSRTAHKIPDLRICLTPTAVD